MDKLYVFGTGNAQSIRYYNTCFAIDCSSKGKIFCDAGGGNGIMKQFQTLGIEWNEVHHLIITHAHSDHLTGVLWIIRMVSTAMNSGKYQGELHIYCHESIKEGMTALCRLSLQAKMHKHIGQDILFHNVEDDSKYEMCGRKVHFFDILSTKMLQYGFTLPLEKGGKLCCLGDEPYNMMCAEYVEGAEWLLCEAFCLYGERGRFKPYEKNHSTVKEACELAQQLGIPNLVIWHTEDSHENRQELYSQEGKKYYHGNLHVPEDLDIIPLHEGNGYQKRVIIAGGRDYTDYDTLQKTVDEILKNYPGKEFVILSGGATGTDALGERYAAEHGYPLERYPAEWLQYGKAAGPIRNREMANVADVLIAFWDRKSHGTASMITEAKYVGLDVYVHSIGSAEISGADADPSNEELPI